MLIRLEEQHIDAMLKLQDQCLKNADIFLPTSHEGYLRAFQFNNFCYGYMQNNELIAFLNCSVPSARSQKNLGRGRVPDEMLDRVGHMNTLLVDSRSRHHGIGHDLVMASLKEFNFLGCNHVFVTASPENRVSLRLLDSVAFRCVDTIFLLGERRYLLYRNLDTH